MELDPVRDPAWTALLERSPDATIFHHPAWLRLVGEHYGYDMRAVVVDGPDGAPEAGLPTALIASRLTGRRLVAVPFADACGPLVAEGAAADARARLAAAVERLRVDRGVPLLVHEAFPELPEAVVTTRFLRHVIDLRGGPEEASAAFASRTRRNARKATRSGLAYERRTDREALDAFYGLHVATRRRLGVPTQPRRFIRGLERLFAEGLGFVGLVSGGSGPAAAAVFLGVRGRLLYKYGASDAAQLGARPNDLLFTEAIRGAAGGDWDELDLGRTDLGHEGLREFKLGWGAAELELAYTSVGGDCGDAAAGRGGAVLERVIRRSPPWVGRAVGELLYRHAG